MGKEMRMQTKKNIAVGLNRMPRLFCLIWVTVLFFGASCVNLANAHECNLGLEYQIGNRADGGFELTIICQRRIQKMITAEGFFPKTKKTFKISLIGNGNAWSEKRNQEGFFYPIEKIVCKAKAWDMGYVWVDQDRKNIFLNFYWVQSPNKLKPSIINAKYPIPE